MSGFSRSAPCNTGNVRSHPACCFPTDPIAGSLSCPPPETLTAFISAAAFIALPGRRISLAFRLSWPLHNTFSWPLQQLFFLRQLDFFPPPGRIFRIALSFTGNSESPRNVTSQKGKRGTGAARGQGGFRERHKRPRHHTGIRALLTAALLPACVVSSPAARWLCKRRGCLMIRRGIRSLIFATRIALNSFKKGS